jgi:hypothetical protein
MSVRRWIDSHAVGFEDIPFMVIGTAQWESEPLTVLRRVPGGNVSYRQYLGRGPETVTYELVFASIDEYHDFKLLQGATGTLTLRADTAALNDRGAASIAGVHYDRLTDVHFVGIETGSTEYRVGSVRCRATFERAVSETAIDPLRIGATTWP